MKQKIYKYFLLFMLSTVLITIPKRTTYADEKRVIINDQLDLITDEQENILYDTMIPISDYGGVAFVTGEGEGESTAESLYRNYFGTSSGTLLYIDLEARKICIFSDGDIYKSITKSRANEITNSVYRYASDEDYFTCAKKAFESIYSVLKGQYIVRPMRYLHNLFLSIALSSIIMYLYVFSSRVKLFQKSLKQDEKRLDYILKTSEFKFTNMSKRHVRTIDHSSNSSSGSSGGGGGGGSSSGGGGSSGF